MRKFFYLILLISTQVLANSFQETLDKAHNLYDSEMYQEAYLEYKKITETDNQNFRALAYMGMGSSMYEVDGKEQESLDSYTIIADDDYLLRELSYPARVILYQRLGWLNDFFGNYPYSFKFTKLSIDTYEKHFETKINDDSFNEYCLALYNTAISFYDGTGIEQNYQSSFDYFNKSASICDEKESFNYIGVMYEQGTGVEQSFEKAIDFFLQSMEGELPSLYGKINYGFLLANGFGIEKNTEKAMQIFEEVIQSEEASYDEYLITLAEEYRDIILNNDETFAEKNMDYVNSFVCDQVLTNSKMGLDTSSSFQKCLNHAQNNNDYSSQYYMGYFYELGIGTNKDLNVAASWYNKSSSKSDDSKYNLAKLIQQGRLDNFQLEDAIILFEELKKSPLNNDIDKNYVIEANYELGLMYRHGVGVQKDLEKAKIYFEKIKDAENYYGKLSLKELDLIKAEKAGFYTTNNILNFFPAEFKGTFKWEKENKISDINNFKFDQINQVGVSNFLLEGSYEIENSKVDIRAYVDSNFNNIEIWETGSNQENESFDFNGTYVGFINKNFTNLNAFWIPYSSGDRGILNLERTNEIKSTNRDKDVSKNINWGKYYALVIGNNNYDHLISLETAIADANAVAEVLKNKYGFEIIDVIIDGDYKKIKGSLNNLKNIISPYDNLLIYYAGHGHEDFDTGFWIPVDGNDPVDDDDTFWISSNDISRAISKIPAKHILVIADSCYSGTLVERGSLNSNTKRKIDYYTNLLNKKARRAITSGANEPVVDGGGEGHSIFASAFLKILSNQNQIIEASELYTKIKKKVSDQVPQTPQYGLIPKSGDQGGEFIFVPIN